MIYAALEWNVKICHPIRSTITKSEICPLPKTLSSIQWTCLFLPLSLHLHPINKYLRLVAGGRPYRSGCYWPHRSITQRQASKKGFKFGVGSNLAMNKSVIPLMDCWIARYEALPLHFAGQLAWQSSYDKRETHTEVEQLWGAIARKYSRQLTIFLEACSYQWKGNRTELPVPYLNWNRLEIGLNAAMDRALWVSDEAVILGRGCVEKLCDWFQITCEHWAIVLDFPKSVTELVERMSWANVLRQLLCQLLGELSRHK